MIQGLCNRIKGAFVENGHAPSSIADELLKFKALLDSGAITENNKETAYTNHERKCHYELSGNSKKYD